MSPKTLSLWPLSARSGKQLRLSTSNICTIHDIAKTRSRLHCHEYGWRTLKPHAGRPLELEQLLEISMQVANALDRHAKASSIGTLSRESLVTKRGHEDSRFGLAKITATSSSVSQAPPTSRALPWPTCT